MSNLSRYQGEEWADVVPIPQNEGGPNPLAAIAYTEEYSEASDYLRAVMAADEKSERALKLTEHIISMNPAHYTVWVYRASILSALKISPKKELDFLTSISLRHLKNYQIWHHRQVIVDQLPSLPEGEPEFLSQVLSRDVKNYHVWSYRQWLVSRFGLWANDPSEESSSHTELAYVEKLLNEDVRNNSAWHHRFFVVFGKKPGLSTVDPSIPLALVRRELDFAKSQVRIAPQNQSAWNYLHGVLRKIGGGGVSINRKPATQNPPEEGTSDLASTHIAPLTRELRAFAEDFAPIERPDDIRSSFALDFLATAWAEEGDIRKAEAALDLLADRFDPIRQKYWTWRKNQIQGGSTTQLSSAGASRSAGGNVAADAAGAMATATA